MFRRKTCFPDLAIYIVIYDMNAGRLSIYMGKIVVFCKAPKKLVSRARSKPLFMKSDFTRRSKIVLLCLKGSGPFVPKMILWGTPKASRAAPSDPRAPRPSPGRHRTDKTRHFRHMRPHFLDSVGTSGETFPTLSRK